MQFQYYLMFLQVPYSLQHLSAFKLFSFFDLRVALNFLYSNQYSQISLFSDSYERPNVCGYPSNVPFAP